MWRKSAMELVGVATLLALTSTVKCQLLLPQCDVTNYSQIDNFSDLLQGPMGEKVVAYTTAYSFEIPIIHGLLTSFVQPAKDVWKVTYVYRIVTELYEGCPQIFNATFTFNNATRRLESVGESDKVFIYRIAGNLQTGLLLYMERMEPHPMPIQVFHVMTSMAGFNPDIFQFQDVIEEICGVPNVGQFLHALSTDAANKCLASA